MKVIVKLFAALRQGRDNKTALECESGITPAFIIHELKIEPDQVAIVIVNGIPAAVNTELNDGDTVSLLPPIGGG